MDLSKLRVGESVKCKADNQAIETSLDHLVQALSKAQQDVKQFIKTYEKIDFNPSDLENSDDKAFAKFSQAKKLAQEISDELGKEYF